jgi:hypothetical protein
MEQEEKLITVTRSHGHTVTPFKNPVTTAKKTHRVSTIKINWLLLFTEIIPGFLRESYDP